MFEKEAEEIAKDIYIHHFDDNVNYPCVLQAITAGVQKGAEFGYNKANEWHDLRKNPKDLPEKMGLGSVEVYVAYEGGVTDFACYRFDKKCWERSEDEEEAVNVIAWREIPTFKENE